MMYDRRCYKLPKEEVQERLRNDEPHTIRMLVPGDQHSTSSEEDHHSASSANTSGANTSSANTSCTIIRDLVLGETIFPHHVIDDQILMKSDGFPTYHLASVVDDHYMEITHVIRGEEWLPSTPKHQLLYEAFEWDVPMFAHLPLLLNSDRSKLSKRQGDVAVEDYMKKGYLPAGLCNFVALLGWNPGDGETNELYTPKKLIESFSLERINKGGAVVDRDKLFWMNGEHIRMEVDSGHLDALAEAATPFIVQYLSESRGMSRKEALEMLQMNRNDILIPALKLLSQRARTLEEFGRLCEYFFLEPTYNDATLRSKMWDVRPIDLLEAARDELMAMDDKKIFQNPKELKTKMKLFLKQSGSTKKGHQMKELFLPLRYAVSGTNVGADLIATMVLLGKDKCVERLNRVLALP